MSFLKVEGPYIVDESGKKVFLRGVCFGGWLNMENFITGYPGAESNIRRAIKEELGEERYKIFFKSLLDSFITEDDFKFLSEIGTTVVRIPFNYRHFEDDMNPGKFDPNGFYYLDRAIEWGKKYNIYIILDLHAAPGWQNRGWHSDNPYGITLLWGNRDYQERVKNLWVYIAEHYKDEPYVAGYNLLNEPDAPNMEILNRLYKEWTYAIRSVDKRHIIFIEGNRYSQVFEGLDEPFDDNLVYSSHNYTIATHRARKYPGYVGNVYADKNWMEKIFLERNSWILERKRPSWVGEFGALFDGPINAPTNADKARLMALKDQLEVFNKYEQHWTIWTYKDVGVQGLAVPKEDCEYMRRIKPILKLKEKLGLDSWTSRGHGLLAIETARMIEVIAQAVSEELKDYSLDYTTLTRTLGDRIICGAISNFLAPLYALQFADMTETEIEEMHHSAFEFSNCAKRTYLIEVLKEAMRK
ncbi:glycoside hydrolase family 5 protein [bacterium]|nr:glycoside hydrolase family 5 protein [bacterium]